MFRSIFDDGAKIDRAMPHPLIDKAAMPIAGLLSGREGDMQQIVPAMYQAWGAYGYLPSMTWYQLANMYTSWTYTAIEKIARTVSSLPVKLYRYEKQGSGKTIKPYLVKSMLYSNYGLSTQKNNVIKALRESGIKRVEIDEHPLLDLINRPNQDMVRSDFWRLLSIHLELNGAVGIYKTKYFMGKVPTELHILPTTWTGQFKPIPANDGVHLIKGYKLIDQDLHQDFSKEEIIWIKYSSLRNPYEGMSAIKAQLYAFNLDQYLMQQMMSFYKNGAMFSNLFKTEQRLTQTQWEEIQSQFTQYEGPRNAFQNFIAHSGIEPAKAMNTTARDAMVHELSDLVRDKLLSASDLSAGKIGLEANQNRSNLEVVDMGFFNEAIKPRVMLITEYIDQFLVPEFDDRLYFEFDTPHFNDRELDMRERYGNLEHGYTSINEEREEEGKDPIEGGDTPRISAMLVELGTEKEPSVPPMIPPKEGEPPVTPQPEEKALWTADKKILAWKEFDQRATKYERLFRKVIIGHFKKLSVKVIDLLERHGVKIKSNIAAMNLNNKQQWIAEHKNRLDEMLPDKKETVSNLVKDLRPVILSVLTHSAEYRMDVFKNQKAKLPVEVTVTFDPKDPRVLEWVDEYADDISEEISDTTYKSIKEILRKDYENAETLSNMSTHIRQEFEDMEVARADTIARTTSTAVANRGDLEGVMQMGLEDNVGKVWLPEQDDWTRDTHRAAGERYSDGYDSETEEVMSLDKEFIVGNDSMLTPGDGSEAEENCNCRCTILYEVIEK
jgi:HK97 family phage portal protein